MLVDPLAEIQNDIQEVSSADIYFCCYLRPLFIISVPMTSFLCVTIVGTGPFIIANP